MSDFLPDRVWLKIEYCCSKIEQGRFKIYLLSLPTHKKATWNNLSYNSVSRICFAIT